MNISTLYVPNYPALRQEKSYHNAYCISKTSTKIAHPVIGMYLERFFLFALQPEGG